MAEVLGSTLVVVDANIIVAALVKSDTNHERAVLYLEGLPKPLYVPILALSEIAHLLENRIGPHAEMKFVEAIINDEIRPVYFDDRWDDVGLLARTYLDSALGLVDASVVVTAASMGTRAIATDDDLFSRIVHVVDYVDVRKP